MKKLIVMLAVGSTFLFGSCAQTNVIKSQMETGKEVRGTWTLTNVGYENLNGFAVSNVFDTTKPDCYVGSTWNLVQNNKTGTYTLNSNDANCASGTAKIIWDIKEEGSTTYFTFKDITGIKAKQNTAGYKLRLDYVDANSMTLVQDVNAEGRIGQIVYNFQR